MRFLVCFLLSFSILICACSSTPKQADEEMNKSSLKQSTEDEVTIGREMAARLFARFGNYENSKALQYVNFVGRTISDQVGRPELVYRFAILDTADENGYACPGGYIFVTRGLLSKLHNEDELATVLAHEIAHVNAKHMYQTIQAKKKITWTETLARFFTHGYGDLGASLSMIVDQGLNVLLNSGYGMEKEFEADKMGITFAAAAGYDPKALTSALTRISKSGETEVLGKTHPPLQQRLNSISRYSSENALERGLIPLKESVLRKRFAKFKLALDGSA